MNFDIMQFRSPILHFSPVFDSRERECPKDSERRQIDQRGEDTREQQKIGGVQEPHMRPLWHYNYACSCPSSRGRNW